MAAVIKGSVIDNKTSQVQIRMNRDIEFCRTVSTLSLIGSVFMKFELLYYMRSEIALYFFQDVKLESDGGQVKCF
jgi:hypothetical protein